MDKMRLIHEKHYGEKLPKRLAFLLKTYTTRGEKLKAQRDSGLNMMDVDLLLNRATGLDYKRAQAVCMLYAIALDRWESMKRTCEFAKDDLKNILKWE